MKPHHLLIVASAALVPILADCAIKGTVLLLGCLFIAICMTKNSAAMRHLVWTVGLIGVIILPLLSLSLPAWRVLPAWMAMGQGNPPYHQPPVPSRPEAKLAASPRQIPPDTLPQIPDTVVDKSSVSTTINTDNTARPALEYHVSANAIDDAVTSGTDPYNIALAIWSVGALLLSVRLALAQCVLWKFQHRTPQITAGPLHLAFKHLQKELGIVHPVRLHLSQTKVSMPVTWGIFRSHIALPTAATGWHPERLRAVLLHELAHVRRRDCLTQLLAHAAGALYWFHPLVWLAAWRMRVERERACDDYVLRNGCRAPDYAVHLLHIVSGSRAQRALHRASSVAMADRSGFESRLEAVLDGRADRRALTRTALLLALLGTALLLLPVAMLRAAAEQPMNEHPMNEPLTTSQPDDDNGSAQQGEASASASPTVSRDQVTAKSRPQGNDLAAVDNLKVLAKTLSDHFYDREARATALIVLMNMLQDDRPEEAAAASAAIEATGWIKSERSKRHFSELRKALTNNNRARITEHTDGIKAAIQTAFWSSLRYVSIFRGGKQARLDREFPLASGRADASGLVQSVYLKPHKSEYKPGEVVELCSVVRNTGKEPVLVELSYMSTEGKLTTDAGTNLTLDWLDVFTFGTRVMINLLLLPSEEFELTRRFSLGISADGVVAKGCAYEIESYPGEILEAETSTRCAIKIFDRSKRKFIATHRANAPKPVLVSGRLPLAVARNKLGNKHDIHWADPIDGIAVGIKLDKRRLSYGHTPPLAIAHVKLSSDLDNPVIKGPAAFILEVDGQQYRYSDQSGPLSAVTDFKTTIPINDDWVSTKDGKRLNIWLGIHTARVHFMGKSSPPVSFELLRQSRFRGHGSTGAWQDPWGQPIGGIKVGLRTLKPTWSNGESPQIAVRLRNDNEQIKKGDVAAIEDANRRLWTKATPADFVLELDGVQYHCVKQIAGWGRGLWPGGHERNVFLKLEPEIWKDLGTIPAGKHQLRVTYKELDLDPSPVSNLIEFEVR